MNHSDTLDLLANALSTAQGEFESVAKDAANPFFKSSYASLPAVVQAASPILAQNGLSVSQLLGHDESGDTLTTVLLHKSGQFLADTMQLRPVKQDPQAQGSATTYGRRYAYMAVLGLVADEDDDGNAGTRAPAQRTANMGGRVAPKPKPVAGVGVSETGKAPPPPSPAPANLGHGETGTKPSKEQVAKLRELASAAFGTDWQMLALLLVQAGAMDEGKGDITKQEVGKTIVSLPPALLVKVKAALEEQVASKGAA